MNEKIKLLAKQAGGNPNYKAFFGHFLPPPPDYIDPATVDLEKFAELIVKECAKVCLNPNHWYEDAAGETFNRVIKQHFGVEE